MSTAGPSPLGNKSDPIDVDQLPDAPIMVETLPVRVFHTPGRTIIDLTGGRYEDVVFSMLKLLYKKKPAPKKRAREVDPEIVEVPEKKAPEDDEDESTVEHVSKKQKTE